MSKCASVALIGRPSSGKSTFVNSVCEAKVSITSPIPQTTRNVVKGVYTDSRGQLIFIDTPGLHRSEALLNRRLQSLAFDAVNGCDIILYMVDAKRAPGAEEDFICSFLASAKPPKVVCVNKRDVATDGEIDAAKAYLASKLPSAAPLVISSLKDEGLDEVLIALFALAPSGPLLYDEETRTDQDLEFRVSEIIREKAIDKMKDEIPHSLYVEVSDMEFDQETGLVWIRAFINVEHESQKGIVVGAGGSNIKRIRVQAFNELRKVFPGSQLRLDLRVKTSPRWRKNDYLLKKLIR